ncbi:MAG: flagellar basal body L-ring protein FlgH, partial [Candidatus Kapabacteria bacterium]|nr:flagellar basal body L-ring protein FlgH [Candidatus Kapabacteria bacterium]
MKRILLTLLCMAIATPVFAQFGEAAARSLFSDVKAYRKGDVITILIVEETEADNTANTNTSTQTNLSISGGANLNNTDVNGGATLGTGNRFQGRGQTNRSDRIRSRLSARITDAQNLNSLKV